MRRGFVAILLAISSALATLVLGAIVTGAPTWLLTAFCVLSIVALFLSIVLFDPVHRRLLRLGVMWSTLVVVITTGAVGGAAWWIFGVLLKHPPPVLVIDYELTPALETGEFRLLRLSDNAPAEAPTTTKLSGDAKIIYAQPQMWYRCVIQNKGPDTLEDIRIHWLVAFFDGQPSAGKVVARRAQSLSNVLTILGPGDSYEFYFANGSDHFVTVSKAVAAAARRTNERHAEDLRILESPASQFSGVGNLIFGPPKTLKPAPSS